MINDDTVVVKHNGTARFPETCVRCLRCPCLNCSPYQVQTQAQVRLCSLFVRRRHRRAFLTSSTALSSPRLFRTAIVSFIHSSFSIPERSKGPPNIPQQHVHSPCLIITVFTPTQKTLYKLRSPQNYPPLPSYP